MITEFEKLKKWEKELHVCIRCGYCYEHCHFFKLSNWETDTPRGKLILIYELIKGKMKPTVNIAEKIFECCYCRNCEKSCSAKVPVTEIFTDAKEALFEAGFDVDGTAAKVDEERCSGCGICVSVCKTEATTLKEKDGKRIASVDKVKCQGCGVCISACPSGARTQKEGYAISPKELLDKVISLLGNA